MNRIMLTLAYDGTDFSGWAAQPGLRTVQSEVESALSVLLRRPAEDVRVTVAGRTDAGVHARGQVAHIDVTDEELARWTGKIAATVAIDSDEAAEARARKLTGVLKRSAPDVVIYCARIVPAEFDARFSALWRRYEYRLAAAPVDPLTRRCTAEVSRPVDFEVLCRASSGLLGLRDFATFCKPREGATTIRELTHFEWSRDDHGAFVARIQADAFCHSMVRALVGAVVAAATGRIAEDRVAELAEQAARSSEFAVMPACGLSLEEVGYPDDSGLAARTEQTRAKRDVSEVL